MGFGDELLVSGVARRIHAMTNQLVRVVDREGNTRSSEVWRGLDYMHEWGRAILVNGPGERQYYSGMEGSRILWRKWDIAPGEIRLTDEEREWARQAIWWDPPFVVIEPKFKASGGGGANKNWGFQKWRAVADAFDDCKLTFAELNPRDAQHISGHAHLKTPTFRHACAILERSIGYVGHEGGLHHAAAALGKPAVVVFGGYISPAVTGYDFHTNLYVPSAEYPLGCGNVQPCQHCKDAMSKITVEQVVSAVKEMINAKV